MNPHKIFLNEKVIEESLMKDSRLKPLNLPDFNMDSRITQLNFTNHPASAQPLAPLWHLGDESFKWISKFTGLTNRS